MPNLFAGSTPAVAAYVTACGQNPTNRTFPKTQVSLAFPPDWDGPVGIDLGLGGTVIGVISATVLSVGEC